MARPYQSAAERAATALADYQAALAELQSVKDCAEPWPADPPGPGYPGTRCELLSGHTLYGTQHRHRVKGSAVTVTW